MLPRSSRIPGTRKVTVRARGSSASFRQPTAARAAAISAAVGSTPRLRENRHRRTKGPMVGSKAPSESRATSQARWSTSKSSALTGTGVPLG